MFLAIDLGGTYTRLARFQTKSKFRFYKWQTPKRYADFLNLLTKFNLQKYRKIVIGFPGILEQGKIFRAPNLPLWERKNLLADLKKLTKAKIFLHNDADLAGLGEAVFGAGQDYQIVAYFTFSTGIGGTRIVHQKFDQAFYGFEPGHQRVLVNQVPIELEWLASGSAIEKNFGQKAEKIRSKRFWEEMQKIWAIGIYNAILCWSPEVVILGGSLLEAKAVSVRKIKRYLDALNLIFPKMPVIKKAKLKEKAFLYGAKVFFD